MKPLKWHSAYEIGNLPDNGWVDARAYTDQITALQREMKLMFQPEEMQRVVHERDAAERLIEVYERALRRMAVTAGRAFTGKHDLIVLEALTKQVVAGLLELHEIKLQRERKR